MDQMNRDYSDILYHPHHVSEKHPHLSKESRAAQFSPYAALTGYDDLIEETARVTDSRVELDESKREELDRKLAFLLSEGRGTGARFTFFQEDPRKEGGEYVTVSGVPVRFRRWEREILLDDGTRINADDLREIEIGTETAETI